MNICVDCVNLAIEQLGRLAIARCTSCGRTDVCVLRPTDGRHEASIRELDLLIERQLEDLAA